jgi:hypothetical protein
MSGPVGSWALTPVAPPRGLTGNPPETDRRLHRDGRRQLQRHEGVHEVGIEVRPGLAEDLVSRHLGRQRVPIGAGRSSSRRTCRRSRRSARQSGSRGRAGPRIARAAPALVVAGDHLARQAVERRHGSHDPLAERGVLANLQRRAQHSTRTWRNTRIPLAIRDPRRRDGAFMEPSGRNRWQPVANGTRSKTAQIGRSATGGNPWQRFRSAW